MYLQGCFGKLKDFVFSATDSSNGYNKELDTNPRLRELSFFEFVVIYVSALAD
jgi:hypothetical protein